MSELERVGELLGEYAPAIDDARLLEAISRPPEITSGVVMAESPDRPHWFELAAIDGRSRRGPQFVPDLEYDPEYIEVALAELVALHCGIVLDDGSERAHRFEDAFSAFIEEFLDDDDEPNRWKRGGQ